MDIQYQIGKFFQFIFQPNSKMKQNFHKKYEYFLKNDILDDKLKIMTDQL